MERTFAIIKPNAFQAGNAGKILSRIYAEGFKVVGIKKLYLSKKEAEGFYHVHKSRPFFGELTDFMSSGPCIVMVLEAADAIKKWRDLMGATNPADAAEGTLRKEFGDFHPWLKRRGVLWSPSYFAASCGGAPIEILRQYIEQQQAVPA